MQLELILPLIPLLFLPFAVTAAGLYFLLWGPLLAYLEAREQAIDGTRHDAQKLIADAQHRTAELEKRLQATRDEIATERAAARKRVGEKQAAILGEARDRAEKQLTAALVEIDKARAVAAAEVRPMATELARDIAAGVLGRQVV